ncbi:uncharacterized protein AB675_10838 [Cyphellophora attinorum]|uniref:Peptidase A1 domain-containing protein n=1 Tax=Cyphellophora attinorum TaxID=1664694 RepID=A0A0N0NMP6_9EURO|nr:uncharacterized protein AB675_10838 [Phialophora attinorum]KPI40701.1 hypothetical protein AB675_10838 [Phialophora attinorum]
MLLPSLLIVFITVQASSATINLSIFRRGGRFTDHKPCNLTHLSEILAATEQRYLTTYRGVDENRLVRRWRPTTGDDDHLLQAIGGDGSWYAALEVGSPPQELQFDLDMLGPDFYTVMTTSAEGSRYNTFASVTFDEDGSFDHAMCKRASDLFELSTSVRLSLPICTPPKASSLTLRSSGSVIGLGPPGFLTRLSGLNILDQLHTQGFITDTISSVTILDAETGVLSLGGTIAKDAEEAKIRAGIELQHFGQAEASPEWVQARVVEGMGLFDSTSVEKQFKWTKTQGPPGWWTTLMPGVWINGAKVMRNQPVLLDIQSPFILAPSEAARQFYAAIGGSYRLPAPHDMFFAIPCLNKVNIAFEMAGWNFPVMSAETTRFDSLHGPPGGPLSLGKLEDGTGYCVGVVVETRMGESSEWADSGLKRTWVLGEPFFRGLGVVFDHEKGRIGLRSY